MPGRPLYVGVGAGAIQLGLWAYVASRRGARVVLAEVDAGKVERIRRNRGICAVNIARLDRIERGRVGPVEILNPEIPKDRDRLRRALGAATDVVTAVPSADLYEAGGVAALLREGLSGRRAPVNVYASENRIGAGRMLRQLVFPNGSPARVRFLETVIERMGGPVTARGLAPLTPGSREALLVEDFERIVVEEPRFPGVFDCFKPTRRIMLHEELKLYGHNAVHFLLGCLARRRGIEYMSDFSAHPELKRIGVDALKLETGGWFRARYGRTGESVATEAGFEAWSSRLLNRIFNPHLRDPVVRVIRDPERKLGWNDRITGTMRRALRCGVNPGRYALGVAAALRIACGPGAGRKDMLGRLEELWGSAARGIEKARVLRCVSTALPRAEAYSNHVER